MGKAEATQNKILTIATEIVATKGYAVSTTKEIAEAAGVAEGTIFKYFKNKENLLANIFSRVIDGLKAESLDAIKNDISRTDLTSIERLHLLYEERQKFFSRHNRVIKIMVQEVPVNPLVRKLVNEKVLPEIMKQTAILFDEGKARGEIINEPTEVLQMAFLDAVLGPIYSSLIFDHRFSKKQLDNHQAIFEIFIRGIEERGTHE